MRLLLASPSHGDPSGQTLPRDPLFRSGACGGDSDRVRSRARRIRAGSRTRVLGAGLAPLQARQGRDRRGRLHHLAVARLVRRGAGRGPSPRPRPHRPLRRWPRQESPAGQPMDARLDDPVPGRRRPLRDDALRPRRSRPARARRVRAPALRRPGVARGRDPRDDPQHVRRRDHGRDRRLPRRLDRHDRLPHHRDRDGVPDPPLHHRAREHDRPAAERHHARIPR